MMSLYDVFICAFQLETAVQHPLLVPLRATGCCAVPNRVTFRGWRRCCGGGVMFIFEMTSNGRRWCVHVTPGKAKRSKSCCRGAPGGGGTPTNRWDTLFPLCRYGGGESFSKQGTFLSWFTCVGAGCSGSGSTGRSWWYRHAAGALWHHTHPTHTCR